MGVIDTVPKRTLVFNPEKKLIAIFHSNTAAASFMCSSVQCVHYACTGKTVSCHRNYFRSVPSDIEVGLEDLGVLKLEEFDELCGIDRKIYKTKEMSRKGLKYKKKKS